MKGLYVLKKHLIVCSLLLASTIYADALGDILSSNKNLLFDYELQDNTAQSDMLENAWINPIMLQYRRNYSKQFADKTVETGSFSVGIDQPIFRSGGIYYAIKYAQAQREANSAEIKLKRRQTIADAVKILFEMKKLALQKKKLDLLVKNDEIEIRQKRESYKAGLIDSSFLDQAILKKNKDETQLLELDVTKMELEQKFALVSDKNPKTLKLPVLKLISAEAYKGKNIELVRDKLRAKQKKYNSKMTWAKYLPAVSVQGRYVDEDLNPLFPAQGIEGRYFTYGFTISMPLNINMFSDIEVSKVASLKAQTEVMERKHAIDEEYRLVQNKLQVIEKKIALAKKDEKLYIRLYKNTKNLTFAGEKTSYDTIMMHNSLMVKKIDRQIFMIDKQIELLTLYAKVENAI